MNLCKLSNLTKIDQYRENYKLEFLYNFYKYFFLHIVHLKSSFCFFFFIINYYLTFINYHTHKKLTYYYPLNLNTHPSIFKNGDSVLF